MAYYKSQRPTIRSVELYDYLEKSKGPGLFEDECQEVVRLARDLGVEITWRRSNLDGTVDEATDHGLLMKPCKAPRWSGETSYDKSMRLIREKAAREKKEAQDAKQAKAKRATSLKKTQMNMFGDNP